MKFTTYNLLPTESPVIVNVYAVFTNNIVGCLCCSNQFFYMVQNEPGVCTNCNQKNNVFPTDYFVVFKKIVKV